VWADIAAVGVLSGIGFTVSMLLSDLSFPSDGFYADEAKAAVLVGSTLAALFGALLLTYRTKRHDKWRKAHPGQIPQAGKLRRSHV